MKKQNYSMTPYNGWYLERAKKMDGLVTQGKSVDEIAERFGVLPVTVMGVLKRYWLTCDIEIDIAGSPARKAR